MLVGRVRNGRAAVFCCVCGYGGRQAWRSTVLPTCPTPFLFRPMHAWLVWCWPACVWSVYGDVVAAAVVLFVHACLSRSMAGLFAVSSLALQQAFAPSDVVVVMPVSVLVGNVPVALGRHGTFFTLRRPLIVGEKSSDSWYDRWGKFPNSVRHALSRPGGSVTRTTHHLVFRSALRPVSQLRL